MEKMKRLFLPVLFAGLIMSSGTIKTEKTSSWSYLGWGAFAGATIVEGLIIYSKIRDYLDSSKSKKLHIDLYHNDASPRKCDDYRVIYVKMSRKVKPKKHEIIANHFYGYNEDKPISTCEHWDNLKKKAMKSIYKHVGICAIGGCFFGAKIFFNNNTKSFEGDI